MKTMKTRRSNVSKMKSCSNSDQQKDDSRRSSSASNLKAKSSKTNFEISTACDNNGLRCNMSDPEGSKRRCNANLRQDRHATEISKNYSSVCSSDCEDYATDETENRNSKSHQQTIPNLCRSIASKVATETSFTLPPPFSKTLKICCERVDHVPYHSTKRRKQKFVLKQDFDEERVAKPEGNAGQEEIPHVDVHIKDLKEPLSIQGVSLPTGCTTPTNRRTADLWEESPVKLSYAKSEADNTELDRSFRLDVLNMGYSHSPKPSLTQQSIQKSEKGDKKDLKLYLNVTPTVGNFRITAPLYQCAANLPGKSVYNVNKLKNCTGGQKRKPVKRKLCKEIRSSSNTCSTKTFCTKMNSLLRKGTSNSTTPSTSRPYTFPAKSQNKTAKHSTQGKEQIWLSPCLQIDTMGCNALGGIKKDYNRVVIICVYGSSFTPQRSVSAYPDAVNARVTYDICGKVAVIEPLSMLSPGIYRVIYTTVAENHECLTRTVAMETLLTKCSSVEELKPHSQYVLITDMYRVPKRQWREKLSATVVRLHLEDYLHTANFHKYALPLLRWNGEEDSWSWTEEKAVKFHAKRKRKSSPSTGKSLNTEKKVKVAPQSNA